MSILPSVYSITGKRTTVPENPFMWQQALRYDSAKATQRWGILNDLLGALIIDTHPELKKAWNALVRSGINNIALKKLLELPLAEEEALKLAKDNWNNPEAKNRQISRWVNFARRKYAQVSQLSK
jgi:hypothetical protein